MRRQHPLGPYVVDFVVLSRKLVIEFDGPVHEIFEKDDAGRDAWLRAEGYRVLRLPNAVALDPDRLVDIVRKAAASPSPQGGGGQGAG